MPLTEKDLNDLLWSVDRTVRRVLNSQEIRNLGADISQSLGRAGIDISDSLNRAGEAFSQYTQSRGQTPDENPYNPYSASQPDGGDTPPYDTKRIKEQNYTNSYRDYPAEQEPNWRRGLPILFLIGGCIGAALSLMMTAGTFVELVLDYYPPEWVLPWLLFYGVCAVGSIGVAAIAGLRLNHKKRMQKIWRFLRHRDFCKISEISAKLQLSNKKIVQLVEKMLDKGYLETGYFDEQKTCLMLTDETYQRYLEGQQSRRQAQESRAAAETPQKTALSEMVREGSSYIRRIREINNDLPDPVISAKLDDLEKVCQQIFSYVGDHPDKLSSIRKLMSYYLPTTLKLLEAYRKLERQNTGAESEQKTKQEILRALDDINLAFQNLLNDLMQNEYLDLSADISVLQSMLAQEGLKGGDFTPDQKNDARLEQMGTDLQTGADPFDGIELELDNNSKEKEYEPELKI